MMGMDDIAVEIIRGASGDLKGTPGTLIVWSGDDILFECKTLELEWEDNAKNISCIPEGDYAICPREVGGFAARGKKKFGHSFVPWIRVVDGRDYILCHWGNFLRSTKGCVLLGTSHGSHCGQHCVWHSAKAYRQFHRTIKPYLFDPLGNHKRNIPLRISNGLCEEEVDLSEDRSAI